MLTLALALTGATSAQAQQVFEPHWYVTPQVGMGYHVGEASFGDLLSPAFQLGVGRQLQSLYGVRASLSGFQARNWQCHPNKEYKWNYLQGNIDGTLSLPELLLGWDANRAWNVYALAGVGLNLSFHNQDANDLARTEIAPGLPNVGFENLWNGKKIFLAGRVGLGFDYNLTDAIALNAEYNANVLPDDWNSKKGKNDNLDWQMNLLAGVRINIGQTLTAGNGNSSRKTAAPVEEVLPPDVFAKVYFPAGSSDLPDKELGKLQSALDQLRQSSDKRMIISGFEGIDQPVTYSSLSKKRAEAIKEWLVQHGADASRIDAAGKGMKKDGTRDGTRSAEIRIE